jgi:hypothetical protein
MEIFFVFFAIILIAWVAMPNAPKPDLRDYYAARAPQCPEWFKPIVRARPVKPEYTFDKFKNHPLDDLIQRHYDFENEKWYSNLHVNSKLIPDDDYELIPKTLKDDIAAHEAKMDEWVNLDSAWLLEEHKSRLTQWAFYYADLMIEKRKPCKV